jgi:multidrug efflux pump subunit AcrA (membrane-fusion protein)
MLATPEVRAQGVDMTELKRMEVERLRVMSEAGSIPRARLEQAQAELADSEDNSILRRTLYGTVRIEDFTKDQSELMTAAAQRLLDRQQERFDRTKDLVAEGIVARASLAAMLEDLEYRRKALDLANHRAKLVEELSEQANAEGELDEPGPVVSSGRLIERFDGSGIFRETDFLRISSAFQKQFGKVLPVSAKGDTALHRSLGFNHRGRVDIAVNPDQKEGAWLRSYLQKAKLPYYAFRAAIRGKATAPHIHLGPPSTRYRVAD